MAIPTSKNGLPTTLFYRPLVEATAKSGITMKEVSADKAHLSAANLNLTVSKGAVPYVPFKTNSKSDNGTALWAKLYYFYNFKREEFLTHYHKRSNVETTFHMIKSKFGEKATMQERDSTSERSVVQSLVP